MTDITQATVTARWWPTLESLGLSTWTSIAKWAVVALACLILYAVYTKLDVLTAGASMALTQQPVVQAGLSLEAGLALSSEIAALRGSVKSLEQRVLDMEAAKASGTAKPKKK